MKSLHLLDTVEKETDEFLSLLEMLHLTERININRETGKATVEVENNSKSLFKDVRTTVQAAKKLIQDIFQSKKHAVTSSYLKYFRLLSKNGELVSKTIARCFADAHWKYHQPKQVVLKGKKITTQFIDAINVAIDEVNDKIYDKNYKIKRVPDVYWTSIPRQQIPAHQEYRDREKYLSPLDWLKQQKGFIRS